MTTPWLRFTQMARENPKMRFTSLMGMLFRSDGLLASFERQPAQKAVGVDGIRKDAYAVGVAGRIADLIPITPHLFLNDPRECAHGFDPFEVVMELA